MSKSGSVTQSIMGTACMNNAYGCLLDNAPPSTGYSMLTRPGSNVAAAAPSSVSDGQFMFVSMVHKSDGTRYTYFGGSGGHTIITPANQLKGIAPTPLKYAVGNGYYPGGFFGPVEVAEFIHIPYSVTLATLDAIYARSAARMSARPTPISVY